MQSQSVRTGKWNHDMKTIQKIEIATIVPRSAMLTDKRRFSIWEELYRIPPAISIIQEVR
jgi:hypothetical protein